MLRRLATIVVVAATALALPACSDDAATRVLPAAESARTGGTLRVAIAQPGSIDPGNAHDAAGRLVVQTMCDPLIQFDPITGEPKPAIAESWQLSDRGKKLTLRVRRGAKFSNGDDVTANDVLFSLSRLASADFASFESDLVAPVIGYPFVHGDEDTDNEDLRRSLRGIKVIEGNSLEIELVTEFAPFIRALGHPAASPVPREEAEADPQGFESQPICAGPYRMSAPWKPGDSKIVLERSPEYNAQNAAYTAGGEGYADKIEFSVFAEPAARLDAYNGGSVDIAEVPADRLAEVRAQHPGQVIEVGAPGIEYVGLPAGDEVFKDARVRLALSLALNRRGISDSVYGGSRAPATGFLPPILGEDLYREQACPAATADGDLDRARALMEEAGRPLAGRKVTFSFNDEFNNRGLAEAVAAQWRDAFGFEVELQAVPWQDYLTTGIGAQGFSGAFRVSWAATHPVADEYLAPLFSSEGIGKANFARFSDPDFDRRLRFFARRALDEEERALEYRRLEDLACGLMPMIPVTFDVDHYLVRSDVVDAPESRLMSRPNGAPALREIFLRS